MTMTSIGEVSGWQVVRMGAALPFILIGTATLCIGTWIGGSAARRALWKSIHELADESRGIDDRTAADGLAR
jgi:hypothetical protein